MAAAARPVWLILPLLELFEFQRDETVDKRPVDGRDDVWRGPGLNGKGADASDHLIHPRGGPDGRLIALEFSSLDHPLLAFGQEPDDLSVEMIDLGAHVIQSSHAHHATCSADHWPTAIRRPP